MAPKHLRARRFGKPLGTPSRVQGYFTGKKTQPPRTLPYAYAQAPQGVLGGRVFSYERGAPVQGYLGYKKPELKKPYWILPPRFLNYRRTMLPSLKK